MQIIDKHKNSAFKLVAAKSARRKKREKDFNGFEVRKKM